MLNFKFIFTLVGPQNLCQLVVSLLTVENRVLERREMALQVLDLKAMIHRVLSLKVRIHRILDRQQCRAQLKIIKIMINSLPRFPSFYILPVA
jgi:hypothetical protein